VPLAKQLEADDSLWFGLFGGSQQVDLTRLFSRQAIMRLCLQTISCARSMLAKDHVDVGGRLHVAAMKLLRLDPGKGPQRVHCDTIDHKNAIHRFSFLLYCSEGVSTFVPKLPNSAMKQMFLEGKTMTDDQAAFAKKMCVPENFDNFPTVPGNSLIFRTDVAHYGPRNDTGLPRYAVYILFSPTQQAIDEKQDDEQRLPQGRP
jgi:hypothetical protein